MVRVVFAMIFLCVIGCTNKPGGQKLHEAASYDPEQIVDSLMSRLDVDKDGNIDTTEALKQPALQFAWASFDKNNNRLISRDELLKRIQMYAQGGTASVVPLDSQVTVGGSPLANATIQLTPDPAFKTLKPALGQTDQNGYTIFKVEGSSTGGVPAGLYDVTITNEAGMPVYKGQLGREVFDDGRNQMGFNFSF